MSLHDIVEPAGTLQTGQKLTDQGPDKADIPNRDAADPGSVPAAPDPAAGTHSKWELRKVG